MRTLFLIKPGEIELKRGNKHEFTQKLKDQIHRRLKGFNFELEEYPGRFFLSIDEKDSEIAFFILQHCPGINGVARAIKTDKRVDSIVQAAVEYAAVEVGSGAHSFKIETRRSDKSFPLDSYGLSAAVGAAVQEHFPALTVDVHTPDFVLMIEIRERAYIYSTAAPGPRGLPVGCEGKGLLLLSGASILRWQAI